MSRERSYRDQAYTNQQNNVKQVAKRRVAEKSTKTVELLDNNKFAQTQQKFFSRPAIRCTLCGYPMDYNGYKPDEWEKKWSTHKSCRDKAHSMLDRATGITRERRMMQRRNK